MMKMMVLSGAVAATCCTLPAFATDAPRPIAAPAAERPVAAALTPAQRQGYAQVLTAIRAKRWADARALLDTLPAGPLHASLRAELLLAPDSPRAEITDLLPLLTEAPDLPQAARLAKLAEKRGASAVPALPGEMRLAWAGSSPRRTTPDSARGAAAAALERSIPERIKADDPVGAEALLTAALDRLDADAKDEWRQRVAWSYYIENDDANALRLATESARGTSGWATQGAWVQGLAAWRTGDYRTAGAAFDRVAREAPDAELRAAAHYWAARSMTAMGFPQGVQSRLRAAAANEETLYGMLAAETLGIEAARQVQPLRVERTAWQALEQNRNVRAAIAFAEIGETRLADEALRHQARIGGAQQHDVLLAIAAALSLPETQLYLAHNTPQGRKPAVAARYPAPQWEPNGGWKVDPALVYAHTLQESRFQRNAVSGAGATGLMQVRPGTARDLARWRGDEGGARNLTDPAVNMDFGQSYLQYLAKDSSTGGQLPRVIAAYNAGPTPVARWASEIRDNGDPLLYIESIPYWETRGYVGIVLRNYWIYEAQAGRSSPSRSDLAQGRWPRFPTTGDTPVRMTWANPMSDAN